MWFCYTDAPSTVPEKTNQDGIRWSFDLRYQPVSHVSGRDCFPLFTLSGETDAIVKNAENYRQSWHAARDNIVSGKIPAVFNTVGKNTAKRRFAPERKNHVATNGFLLLK